MKRKFVLLPIITLSIFLTSCFGDKNNSINRFVYPQSLKVGETKEISVETHKNGFFQCNINYYIDYLINKSEEPSISVEKDGFNLYVTAIRPGKAQLSIFCSECDYFQVAIIFKVEQ